MTNEEKTSLKAACLQAATTLVAARDCGKGVVDVDECIKLAAELYWRLTSMNWRPESAADEALHAGSNRSDTGRIANGLREPRSA